MNIKRILFAGLCLALCIAFSTACNHEKTAKVTVYFGKYLQTNILKKETIFDRIFYSLVGNAHAQSLWTENYDTITLTITGDDMDPITRQIPHGALSYTVEVPMGDSRLFTLFAYEGAIKKWGGHVLANANASEVSLSMNVFPVVTGLQLSEEAPYLHAAWYEVTGATGYYLYRSMNQMGPYEMIYYLPAPGVSYGHDVPFPGTYYMRISVRYPQGEGEPCDPQMIYLSF